MASHWRLTYRIPAEIEDDLVADLWQAGTTGVEVRPGDGATDASLLLDAYFLAGPAIAESLRTAASRRGVEILDESRVEKTDWLAAYRRRARPFEIGESLIIDPREPETRLDRDRVTARGRRWLRLPARRAFGIGTHASTRLALALIEETPLVGRSVLDVGTGTGILAFGALIQGARRAWAFDIDPAAVFHARENGILNDLQPGLWAGAAAAINPLARWDCVVVNILLERVRDELVAIAYRVAPGGVMIFAGLLAEQREEVIEILSEQGLALSSERREGEWLALAFKRPEMASRGIR